jgi:CO/xanthine dehydrogenase Mo-binding subunit
MLGTRTRRQFLHATSAAGIALAVRRIPFATSAQAENLDEPRWAQSPGRARYRIEGRAKVTGQKIYARDFRARDMPGWPTQERAAMVLRATSVDRRFSDLDLSVLAGNDIAPRKIITAHDLAADNIKATREQQPPQGLPSGIFVERGQLPVYYGQPLAIVVFDDDRALRKARSLLQFNTAVVRYGPQERAPALDAPYVPQTFVTRYAGRAGEEFSQTKNGLSNPDNDKPTGLDLEARRWRARIQQDMARLELRIFEGAYATQALDPVFMEPEAGLGWFERDPSTPTLHLVLGTQSTNGDLQSALALFGGSRERVKTVVLNSCYPGGGFGGRDISPLPTLLSVAAYYCDAPVRMAFTRFEQFQAGLKQLASNMTHRIAVDKEGRFRAITSRAVLPGGGNNNYSQWVAQLAGYSACGGYDIEKAAIDAMAMPTAGVVAGSMRGFGGPQAVFAIETLVDEIAQAIGMDAIELRHRNVLRTGGSTVTGAKPAQDMRLAEICDLARRRRIWSNRAAEKHDRKAAGKLYGVGFALANQAYGTGSDGVMAEVSVTMAGEVEVRTNCIDMGNGSATSLAISTAENLGANANAIHMGEAAYFIGPLGFNPNLPASDRVWSNPRWTPKFSLSSSACMTAFHHVHAVRQASLALFRAGLVPAARRLWRAPSGAAISKLRWEKGLLTAPGHRSLRLSDIVAEIHRSNLVGSAMAHAVHIGRWAQADYDVDGQSMRLDSDGLSTRLANDNNWRVHDRSNVVPPPPDANRFGRSLYAPSGVLVAVEIDRKTGDVSVLELEAFLDCGRVIQPQILSGQWEGGVAMGIGYALFEHAAGGDDGPGNGQWNLNRYRVALARDVPTRQMKLTLLGQRDRTAKGIAEAVLCPVPAAIANAIADATGHRFRSLPITSDQVREVLR